MRPFDLIAIMVVLAAGFSYLNYRLLKLPSTIGLMALTLAASVALVAITPWLPHGTQVAERFVQQLDLGQTLLHGLLGFLLFAGSLHVNLDDLAERKVSVMLLTTLGVLLSTAIVGGLMWCVLNCLGIEARLIYCLLFGALISPTDPIAVLALLKQFGAPKPLETTIAGESLFNDGVGVVVFLGLLEIAQGGGSFDPAHLAGLFVQEAIGGAVFGLAVGLLVYRLLKSVDNYQVEILLSLALVAGGYALAFHLHLSGPIAMVVAGLLIGNTGRRFAMSPSTVQRLDDFWELIDEILNAVLFVLIGLEVLILPFTVRYLLAGLIAIAVVLLARLVSVGLPLVLLQRWLPADRAAVRILTWGGLRGGLSVAMALSLPAQVGDATVPERDSILVITYVVVVFSILVQGLTIGPLTRRWLRQPAGLPKEPASA